MSNNEKETHKTVLNNIKRSKSPYTVDSLLLLDNTLLCNIEDIQSSSRCESFHEHKKTIIQDSIGQMENIEIQKTATSEIVQTTAESSDTIALLDKSLMNQVFAQFDTQSEDETASNNCKNTSLNIFDTFCEEDTNDEKANVYLNPNNKETSLGKENFNVSCQDKLNNVLCSQISDFSDYTLEKNCDSPKKDDKCKSPIIQTRTKVLDNCKIPKKRLRLDMESKKNKATNSMKPIFYGLPNSIMKCIQEVKGISELYQWQNECLELAIKSKRNLIYALPTSGGKTLVAEILMLREMICNKKNAIFILPFVALVQEKIQSMAMLALKLGFLVEEYASTKGRYPPIKRRRKNSIYICTIEKALGLVNSLIETKRLDEISIIVVDELHLLGESGGRGATLEGLLTKIMFIKNTIRLVGMSATIGNLKEVAQFLNADMYSQNFRPVEVKEYVKCENNIWIVDISNEELLVHVSNKDYGYPDDIAIIDPDRIGGLVMEIAPNDSCLIFCSTRKNCENVALLLAKVLPKSLNDHKVDQKRTLINVLKTEEGLCPILKKTVKFGVAYHHSGLTSEERRLLEDAFREGTICVICCTSTLAAGVNLPARRVILRSPYIGNQFLNLSKYKQMIGRAGRAGMGVLGESILICKRSEMTKVKDLLTSQMDDSLSALHTDKDRGMNNLILSAIQLKMTTTRSELHKLLAATLLSIQQNKIDINLKAMTDETITALLKYGVITVKDKDCNTHNPNITIVIPSQKLTSVEKSPITKGTKTAVTFTNETEFQLCNLGHAAMKGPIDLRIAHTLYDDLKEAQKHLILIDDLHLLYLVTPYDVISQITPMGNIYYDVVMNLSETQMQVARLLGITEAVANKLRDGIMPRTIEKRVVNRFYITLIVHELWNHRSVYFVAEKYQISRGIIQSLLNAVSMFATCVVRFCQELSEFWAFTQILTIFSKRLTYCCPSELEALMELPSIKIGRARQLYMAGYKTLQSVAIAEPNDLKEKIPYLSNKLIAQIIAAAKHLLLKKAEDLKDEVEDILDGLDLSQIELEAHFFKL